MDTQSKCPSCGNSGKGEIYKCPNCGKAFCTRCGDTRFGDQCPKCGTMGRKIADIKPG